MLKILNHPFLKMKWIRETQKRWLEKRWKYRSTWERFVYILQLPIIIIELLTIPYCVNYRYNILLNKLLPFTIPLLIIYGYELEQYSILNIDLKFYLIFTLAIILVFMCIISQTTKFLERSHHESSFFILLSITMSVIWIDLINNFMIKYLRFFQLWTGRSDEFISVMIIGSCSSIIYLVPLVKLSKHGYGVMTVLNCFSGEIFSMVIGLGIGMV